MNKFLRIIFLGLLLAITGCAYDPYYRPQAPAGLGPASTVSVPGPDSGMDIMESYRVRADRIPTDHQMIVSWDLTMYSSRRSNRPERRKNCEVMIKPAGALNFMLHDCEEVRRMGPDRMVVFDYNGRRMAINLSSQPGGYIQNGFCEKGHWSPARRQTVQVVWSTTSAIRPTGLLQRTIGCR